MRESYSKSTIAKKVRHEILSALIILVVLSMMSCTSSNNTESAQQAITEFHRQIDSEQWHSIYTGADDDFRQSGTEADFSALLQAVHRKLGKIQATHMRDYKETWIAGRGTFLTLAYDTEFAQGKAVETFAWYMQDHRAVLHGYNINSNALILK